MAYLYIVFSSTPYKIGKAIRYITQEEYNHVSIALDPQLQQLYGFARRYYRTPLYGGFVKESPARYHLNGCTAQICVCRVPVTDSQYQSIAELLCQMHLEQDKYLYNHLSILGAPFRRPIVAKDAYTCVEFCVSILQKLDYDLDSRKYYSVNDLLEILSPHKLYTGAFPPAQQTDPAFFAEKPIAAPLRTTFRDMLRLLPRL